ncbi:response regulator transcription factor [Pseudomonas sp. LS44]|uniref:response regulator n=1 Tax=Pseudomonas sp. LS44 TaxID=1357074 RepID=UPI00215A57A8|nr:response regulator transcription factor [Pseudomonas sp. LS44]UVE18925.1 response regulator transcription factor [Pseudomonas sp. LS44]
MAAKLRICIVDDHPLLRQGVAVTLAREKSFEVVEQGGSADEAREIAARQQPDVLLMDVNMPGDTFAAVRDICATYPAIKVMMLTVSQAEEDVYAALEAGAQGYVLKGSSGPELVQAVQNVAAGELFITPQFAQHLLANLLRPNEAGSRQVELTPREDDIIRAVAEGLTNREVADRYGLSEKTVKHHMTSVMTKLHARNRVEAVSAARQHWANARAADLGLLLQPTRETDEKS